MPDENLLTTSQAAELLDVSTATLKRWADAGLLGADRTAGRHRRFRRAALEVFAARHGDLNDPIARWANVLLRPGSVLEAQSLLLRERAERGCWWSVADGLKPVIIELHRRRESGRITVVQWLEAFDCLQRAVGYFVAHAPHEARAPILILAGVLGDRLLIPIALVRLGAACSGWRTRWAGGARSAELEQDLHHAPAQAVLLSASADCDPALVEECSSTLPMLAETGAAVAVIGLGEWPDPLSGGLRLRTFDEARLWLDAIASSQPGYPRPVCCSRHASAMAAPAP